MTLDDESLLSAYLDDELGPADRQRVEAALQCEPRLVDQLAELTALRAMLGGLPRPAAPCDLSARVTRAIQRPVWSRRNRIRFQTAAVILSAAAALAVVVATTLRRPMNAHQPPNHHVAAQNQAAPKPFPLTHDAQSAPAPAIAAKAAPAPVLTANPEESALLAFLSEPGLLVLPVTVDSLDPERLAKIESALNAASPGNPPRGEVRLDAASAHLGNPGRNGPAVVYLMILDGKEIEAFEASLKPFSEVRLSAIEPVAPEAAPRLADLGRVHFAPGAAPLAPRLLPASERPERTLASRTPDPTPVRADADADADPPAADAPAASPLGTLPARRCLVWVSAADADVEHTIP